MPSANVDQLERAHLYLKDFSKGDKIHIIEDGDSIEVELRRRGRRKIRIRRPEGTEDELVPLVQVLVPENFEPNAS